MYCVKTIRESEELDSLMAEVMRLPINEWLRNDNVVVKAYYKDELKGEEAANIRAATEVEVAEIGADAIMMISSTETATFSHLDMLVIISDLLNTIELGYNGRDDTPVVFIRENRMRVNPKIFKYFGMENQVYGPIMQRLTRTKDTEMYCPTDADDPDPAEMSISQRLRINTALGDNLPEGGAITRK